MIRASSVAVCHPYPDDGTEILELWQRLEAGSENDLRRCRLAEMRGDRERLKRGGARLVSAYQDALIGLDLLPGRNAGHAKPEASPRVRVGDDQDPD